MRVMIERCCGLDVHQETVVACLLIGAPGVRPTKEVRTFRTMTRELEALRDWLKAAGVTHVGMESTGVYWRPVYAVLEGHFELIVGNARHIRNVPGRKTDVKDAEWIADLVRHGLIAKSFVPARPLRELRELLRYRRKLVESQSAERNRLLKLLETANIKLASVASDVFGVSGRAMLKTLSEGNASADEIAGLARGQLRRKHDDLVLALEGRVEEHHRFLLAIQLHRLAAAEHDIEALDSRIAERLEPYRTQHALLMQIPGVDWVVAAVCALDGERRIDRLTASPSGGSCTPLSDRLIGEPHRQCTPPHQSCVIVRPVRHTIFRRGDFVAARFVELVRHGFLHLGIGRPATLPPGDRQSGLRSLDVPFAPRNDGQDPGIHAPTRFPSDAAPNRKVEHDHTSVRRNIKYPIGRTACVWQRPPHSVSPLVPLDSDGRGRTHAPKSR